MTTKKVIDIKLFDARAVKRNIDKGHITRAEYNRFLKNLPDNSEETDPIEVDQYAEIAERENRRFQSEKQSSRHERAKAARHSSEDVGGD